MRVPKELEVRLWNTPARKDVIDKALDAYEKLSGLYESELEGRILNGAYVDELKFALAESVKLQSHYAALLNDYDGGKRMIFATYKAWIDRLDAIRKAEE